MVASGRNKQTNKTVFGKKKVIVKDFSSLFFNFFFSETEVCQAAQTGFKFIILLPQPHERWDYSLHRHAWLSAAFLKTVRTGVSHGSDEVNSDKLQSHSSYMFCSFLSHHWLFLHTVIVRVQNAQTSSQKDNGHLWIQLPNHLQREFNVYGSTPRVLRPLTISMMSDVSTIIAAVWVGAGMSCLCRRVFSPPTHLQPRCLPDCAWDIFLWIISAFLPSLVRTAKLQGGDSSFLISANPQTPALRVARGNASPRSRYFRMPLGPEKMFKDF